MIYIHRKDYSPKFGQKVDPLQMKVESDASLTGKIREEFTNQIYHSRSRNMFYTISDLPTVSKLLLNISVAKPGQAASLVFALKEYPEQGRVIACTNWAATTGDCFYSSNIDTTLLFSLSPITQDQKANIEKQVQVDLSNIDNSTYVINSLTADKLLNDTLLNLKIKGLVHLCRSLRMFYLFILLFFLSFPLYYIPFPLLSSLLHPLSSSFLSIASPFLFFPLYYIPFPLYCIPFPLYYIPFPLYYIFFPLYYIPFPLLSSLSHSLSSLLHLLLSSPSYPYLLLPPPPFPPSFALYYISFPPFLLSSLIAFYPFSLLVCHSASFRSSLPFFYFLRYSRSSLPCSPTLPLCRSYQKEKGIKNTTNRNFVRKRSGRYAGGICEDSLFFKTKGGFRKDKGTDNKGVGSFFHSEFSSRRSSYAYCYCSPDGIE